MREKRSRKTESSEPIFDFCLPSVGFNEKIEIDVDGVDETVLDELYEKATTRQASREKTFALISQARADLGKTAGSSSTDSVGVKQEDYGTTQDAVDAEHKPLETGIEYSENDPLKPDVYTGHHRRMERQERHMQALERQQLVITVGQVKAQHAELLRDDWNDSIEKIVKIKDINDNIELERKREMALSELTKFLTKYAASRLRTNSESASKKSKKKSKQKQKPSVQKRPQPKQTQTNQLPGFEPVDDDDDGNIVLRFRPCAFGYMLPPKRFPPAEFSLPDLLRSEVEAYDLIDSLKKQDSVKK